MAEETSEQVDPVNEFTEKATAFLDEHFKHEEAPPASVEETPPSTEAEEAPVSWITDEIKESAKGYGFDESELEGFESETALRASMRALDRQIRGSARDHWQQQQQPPAENKGEAQPAINPSTPAPVKGLEKIDEYLAALEKEYGADEPVMKTLKGFRDEVASKVVSQEQRIDQVQAWIQQEQMERQRQAYVAEAQHFADTICRAHPDLFGESYQRATPDQQAKADKAYGAYLELKYGMALREGKEPAFSQALVDRALQSEFHSHFINKAKQELNQKVKQSAAQRMGGAARQAPKERFQGEVSQDPEVAEIWKRMQEDPTFRMPART